MVEEITIRKIPIKDIVFDESNPNQLSNEQMVSLKLTMEKFGYLAPIVLNKKLEVIDGEHRVRVYQELGKKNIQAYVLDIGKVDKKILRQLMNKLRGEHDKTMDANEFKSIFEAGRLEEFSELLAQPLEDFQQILEKKFDIGFERDEEDEVPELPKQPKAKLGDIYQLGRHRIMCGDSTKDLDKLINDKKIDLLLTDPPYGVDYSGKNKFLNKQDKGNRIQTPIKNDDITNYTEFFTKFLDKISFSDYNTVYIFMGDTELNSLIFALDNTGYNITSYLVWKKPQFIIGRKDYHSQHELILYGWKGKHKFYGGHNKSTIFETQKKQVNDVHPTMKPIEILQQLIKDGSKKNNIIYDPFLGSGSTLIACEQTDRICYGMELDPAYIDVIITRWENYTDQKAKKI